MRAVYNKAMAAVTLSRKNQIVLPLEARKALGLKAGDEVLIVVRGEDAVVLKKPRSHAARIRGIAKRLYPTGYLRRERGSWD